MENETQKENREEQQSYEESIRRKPVMRVMAWVCIFVIFGLFILVFVTGVTGSRYFMPSLALMIIVPILIYVALWLGKVLQNHRKNRS